MSSTTKQPLLLLQHPSHEHPLELLESSIYISYPYCFLCRRKISLSSMAYACVDRCEYHYYYHRVCVEAPPQIDLHPLHPVHPLTLIQGPQSFECDSCSLRFYIAGGTFRCDECEFNLDIGCALSTLSDEGNYQGGKTSEQITLLFHPHTLTSFSKWHDFLEDNNCYICGGDNRRDGYMCLRPQCKFMIHKRCIQDLYYADGTKAPRVYHCHPLKVFVGEDRGSRTCASCGSNKSGEFIGCASCEVSYHRQCFQVPETLRYPSHNLDHTLVLLSSPFRSLQCQSCSSFFKNDMHYGCTSCNFSVHIGCASQVLAYCEEGMLATIKLPWHKHPLLLCHQTESTYKDCFYYLTESTSKDCFYCRDKSIGPTYVCEKKDCGFLLHKRCAEIESITHPHHPVHPLILCEGDDDHFYSCKACGRSIYRLRFSCERCLVNLHKECADRFPTHKHYLHEHELLRLEDYLDLECNRCGRSTDSPLFRCVPCDFNLHEECMELPQVLESKIHWHPLTLHETFLEDESGEYYCEHCENTRDPRLGVYVCGECKLKIPRIYHIECALPEIGKVYEKKKFSQLKKLEKQIADKREDVRTMKEEVRTMEEKLEGAKRELDERLKQLDILLIEQRKLES